MKRDELEMHVNDVMNAIPEGSASREEVRSLLTRYLNDLKVSVYEAKRTVVRKYGGDVHLLSSRIKKIGDLRAGDRGVTVIARVVTVNPKEITVEGVKRRVFYGFLTDETGTVPYFAWQLPGNVKKGGVYKIRNVQVREWQDKLEVRISENTEFIEMPQDAVPMTRKRDILVAKVADLRPRMGAVEVTGKVLSVERSIVETSDGMKEVWHGVLGDETGKVQFSSWGVAVEEGAVIRVRGAYVGTFRGMPTLVMDARCEIEETEEDVEVRDPVVSLSHLEKRGGYDVRAEGVFIDIKAGSGFIKRCPQCGRVLATTSCPVHGHVSPKPDLRIKAVLDDGTGSAHCIVNREITERVLGKTLEEVVEEGKEMLGDYSFVYEAISERLLGRPWEVRGNAIADEFGLTILVRDLKPIAVNVEEEAEFLLEELR